MDQEAPQGDSKPLGKIGRYVLLSELGRGAMGIVYEAKDPTIGRTVAVKTIRMSEMSDAAEVAHIRERMFREAQAAGVLSHPGIVTIYDIQEENGMAYIFMEFVEGETLEKILLSDTPIDKQLILHICKQSAEALDYAHSRGIIHRDIKPANIMVRNDGAAKVADFGIARVQSHSMTKTGQILGTPNYMSPEQIQGKPVDGKTDQYALAVMLYEVFTGEKPFVADSLPTLLFKVVMEAPIPSPRLNPTLDPAIDAALQRALSKDPAARFPTCAEFVRELESACRLRPESKTLPRGGGLTQPTQAVEATPMQRVELPPSPAPAAEAKREAPAKKAAVVDPLSETPMPKPSGGGGIQKALLGLVALVVLGVAGFGAFKFLTRPGTPVEEVKKAETVSSDAGKPEPVKPPPTPPVEAVKSTPPDSRPTPQESKPAQPTTKGPEMMAVSIRSSPDGARIVLGNGATCTAPCMVELEKGRHTLTAVLDDYRNEMRIFNVPQDATIQINLERKKGVLEAHSTPPGATITVDGVEHSQKTPALIPLNVGRHSVVISLPGKQPYSRSFEMRADATVSLSADWGN